MKKNVGNFIPRSKTRIKSYGKVLPNPRKIGILMDGNCASSAEQFLLHSRESKKVILFGQPTSGTLDYSNVLEAFCPSLIFKFGYATTKTDGPLINNNKIKPDIYLKDNENWIDIAVKEIKKN